MSNSHIHPIIQAALRPWCISMHTDKGERGFRLEAPDAVTATKEGIGRLNIRDEEILPAGLCVRVEPTA